MTSSPLKPALSGKHSVSRQRTGPFALDAYKYLCKITYNQIMTRSLEQAFEAASQLTCDEQDALAARMFREIAWENRWESALTDDPEKLRRLVEEARQDIKAGRVRELHADAI